MGAAQSPCSSIARDRPFNDTPLLSFFVVGDIGELGTTRCNVAQAMADHLEKGNPKSFVFATGDNFYDCRGEEQFREAFEQLRADMLDVVHLPWYFALGNHDIKKGGSQLHTTEWHGKLGLNESGETSWEFRCPGTYYSLNDDWSDRAANVDFGLDLIDMIVINTNKQKGLLNLVGVRHGSLEEETISWGEQKLWLQERLRNSRAAWKIVVGHHPIEFVPHSFLEHGLPGVRFLTSKFMKGHATSKLRRTGLRDVIVQGDVDLYLCGHQHLMAHMVRKRSARHGPETLDYVVIGSSSKLEQDREDFEGATDDAEDVGDRPPSSRSELDSDSEAESSEHASPIPASWWMPSIEKKMANFWHVEKNGFAVVDVARRQLRMQFFSVEGQRVSKIYEFIKTKTSDCEQ